jgi:hypothetical protein
LEEKMARLLAACNNVSYLLFSLIGIPKVEIWGRRKMLIFAAAGQSFCYLLITILIRYNEKPGYAHGHEVASASVAFFFLYYVFFGIGMQGVPWLYPTEINSLSMRTKGAAAGTATVCLPFSPIQTLLTRMLELDFQLHGGRNHSHRRADLAVEVLHHLDHPERIVRSSHIFLLP